MGPLSTLHPFYQHEGSEPLLRTMFLSVTDFSPMVSFRSRRYMSFIVGVNETIDILCCECCSEPTKVHRIVCCHFAAIFDAATIFHI